MAPGLSSEAALLLPVLELYMSQNCSLFVGESLKKITDLSNYMYHYIIGAYVGPLALPLNQVGTDGGVG